MSLGQQKIDPPPPKKKRFLLAYWTDSAHQGKPQKHQNQHKAAEKVEFFPLYSIMVQVLAELRFYPHHSLFEIAGIIPSLSLEN